MTVLHLSRGREWRGGERQVLLLARALGERGEPDQRLVTNRNSSLAAASRAAGLDVAAVPWRLGWDPRALRELLRWRRSITGPVILHAHDSHALALGWMLRQMAGRRAGDRLIATRRSLLPPGPLWKKADRIIAISRAVGATLEGAGVAPDRIVHVPSGIRTDAVEAAARCPQRPPGEPAIIAAGALTREKGHAVLIRALARLRLEFPGAQLTVLGEGPERRPLLALAATLGLSRVVAFPGTADDPVPTMAGARLFVQPSLREALGTAALEALATGVPVVASAVGGLPELLGGGTGFLVPPGDPDALAHAMAYALNETAGHNHHREAGRAVARAHDIRELAGRVQEVYRSALPDP